jgi:hypothetical protein
MRQPQNTVSSVGQRWSKPWHLHSRVIGGLARMMLLHGNDISDKIL